MVSSAFAQTSFTRSNTSGTSNIVDDGCFASFATKNIVVSDAGNIGNLDVGIVADHDYRGALQVQLISPSGTNRTIINGVGGPAQDLNVRLRDGETAIAGTTHPPLTSYADVANLRGPSNPLSAYNGEIIAGTWQLRICDSDGFGDVGSLREFYLHFTTAGPQADLSLAMTPSTAIRSPGQQTEFNIILSNDGPEDVSGVTVDASLPTGLSYVSDNGGGTYDSASGLWTIPGTIAAGTLRTLRVVTSAQASGSGDYTVEIASASLGDPDSTPNNGAAGEDDIVTANISLVAPPAAPPSPLSCNAPTQVNWTQQSWPAGSLSEDFIVNGLDVGIDFAGDTGFLVNNPAFGGQTPLLSGLLTGGQAAATSLLYVVNFDNSSRQLDFEMTFGVPGEGVGAVQFGMFDVDENPDLSANANFIDRVEIKAFLGATPVPIVITTSAANTLDNPERVIGIAESDSPTSDGNIWVTIDQPIDRLTMIYDNDPAVNADPGQQGVSLYTLDICELMPDLELSKTVDNDAPASGSNIVYTLSLTNDGSLEATNVQVTDLLPAGLSFVSAAPSQGSYDEVTGLWDVGTVSTTSPPSLAITAQVTAASGTITNFAEVTSADGEDMDSTPNDGAGDDAASQDINVAPAAPELLSVKSVEVYDPNNEGLYAVPGNDVIYSISVTNSGNIAIDAGSIFLVDNFPADIVFYNGDIDDAGPESDAVIMETVGTPGLTLNFAADVGFSDGATAPTSLAGCSYNPAVNSYDPAVRYICFAPQGAFQATDPDSTVIFKFRARIPSN
jgi:uncharacterized repeat protein (TIGR01451 family)